MEPVDESLYKYKGLYFITGLSSPEDLDSLDNFEIRDDDIFVITYSKSGTVWTQNIVSLIVYEGHRDGTENITLIDRAPWLEYNIFHVALPSRPSPHVICSHLPYYLVPKGLRKRRAKIIYVFRNPKDVLASNYYFHKLSVKIETPKDFDIFFEKFLAGKDEQILSSVLKICNFLGRELTEKEVDDVVNKDTFDYMKVDSRANYTLLPPGILVFSKGGFLRKAEAMEPVKESLYKYKGLYFITGFSSPETLDSLDSFEIRDDDIFIITYPRSGTVWTQNIVSLIVYEGHRDGTENITLIDRAPWLEYNIFHVALPSRPSPRVICSHLPYYLIPKGLRKRRAKIIYVLRNPKDVLVSKYHFQKLNANTETPKDFSILFENFLAGKVVNSSWLDHVEGWSAHKGDFNILFLSYEEMKKDLRSSVLKICNFLGRELTEKEMDEVVDKATFDNMKVDSRANYTFMPPEILDFSKGNFLRKGTIGDWKNLMTVAQSERFDRVFKERMKKLPFKFCWDIQEDPEPISSSVDENNV
ncbi:amine sulfotransferase-like isoform X2 [Thamnophis elegans]|uniref:amine sulfotransferase-like isoform X2 n=1 Tax=Thamnophis elegans TaxID=35005 RepID=UPI0013778ADC|nr:amine sulfotransferase-like isoform X2 [Thamnophis elegans]